MKKTLLALAALSLFGAGSAMAQAPNDIASAKALWSAQVPMGVTNADGYKISAFEGNFETNQRLDIVYDEGTKGVKITGSQPTAFRLEQLDSGTKLGTGKYASQFDVTIDSFLLGVGTANASGHPVHKGKSIAIEYNTNDTTNTTDALAYHGDVIKVNAGTDVPAEVHLTLINDSDQQAKLEADRGDYINVTAGLMVSNINGAVDLGAQP